MDVNFTFVHLLSSPSKDGFQNGNKLDEPNVDVFRLSVRIQLP